MRPSAGVRSSRNGRARFCMGDEGRKADEGRPKCTMSGAESVDMPHLARGRGALVRTAHPGP